MQTHNINKLKELDVVVLCGGIGTEVEVSLDSGEAITEALCKNEIKARKVIADGSEEQIMALNCDIVFIALHGLFGEDGTVQRLLERKRIPFTGSGSQVSKLCMDKNMSKVMMQRLSVPVCPWICVEDTDKLDEKLRNSNLNSPVVVKPNTGGSSVGVVIAKNFVEILDAVESITKSGDSAMIEEYVAGIEFTVGILDGKPLPFVELIPVEEFYDYHAKYKAETTKYCCPPERISSDIQAVCADLSSEIYRNFKLRDIARVDYILGENGNLISLEVNSIPGFTSHSLLPKAAEVSGLAFDELCIRILSMANSRGA